MKCDNKIKCPCRNVSCEYHSKCCECVHAHAQSDHPTACLAHAEWIKKHE